MSPDGEATPLAVDIARSFLFVPGDREDRFPKAAASGADQVVCDLEDAVGPGSKQTARDGTVRWLSSGGSACVRINPAGTPWHEEDLRRIADVPGLRGVMVPKAESCSILAQICETLTPRVPMIALVETALGVQNVGEIAAVPGVSRLAFGSLDYCLDTGARHEEVSLLFARSSLVVAARAAGIPAPIDGVTQDVRDGSAVIGEARHALSLGFGAKLCIHPSQVEPVNSAFSPTLDELEWATHVVEAAGSREVTVVDGKMVDKPVLDQARLVLLKHRMLTR